MGGQDSVTLLRNRHYQNKR